MVVVLNEITKTAVVSNGVREQNTARESEFEKNVLTSSGTIMPITLSTMVALLYFDTMPKC